MDEPAAVVFKKRKVPEQILLEEALEILAKKAQTVVTVVSDLVDAVDTFKGDCELVGIDVIDLQNYKLR